MAKCVESKIKYPLLKTTFGKALKDTSSVLFTEVAGYIAQKRI